MLVVGMSLDSDRTKDASSPTPPCRDLKSWKEILTDFPLLHSHTKIVPNAVRNKQNLIAKNTILLQLAYFAMNLNASFSVAIYVKFTQPA